MKNIIKAISVLFILVQFNSYAIEMNLQTHVTDQSGSNGFSVGITDSFFKQKAFNWSISYNSISDVSVDWNEDSVSFSLDTIDLGLSYRYYPKSYNAFIKSLIFEFEGGVGIALTENKFNWPELEEETFFSEQGDINPFVSFAIHKKFNKEASMEIGMKYYTSYSEFGSIGSAYIGFSYSF